MLVYLSLLTCHSSFLINFEFTNWTLWSVKVCREPLFQALAMEDMFAVANLNNPLLLFVIVCRGHITFLESFHAYAALLLIDFVSVCKLIIETYF